MLCKPYQTVPAIGSDGINPVLIKKNIAIISNHLFYIFNLSFAQGVFPHLLKTAKITPISKNGSHNDHRNYRPISIQFEQFFLNYWRNYFIIEY